MRFCLLIFSLLAFSIVGCDDENIREYKITSSASSGGIITPKGVNSVKEGESLLFSISPNDGYGIANVQIDGNYRGPISSYSFNKVNSNHTIHADFEELSSLLVSPATLDFGTSSTSKSFSIANGGGGTLTWSISENTSWITSISPSNGSNNSSINVEVSRENLPFGNYSANISVQSNGGSKTITVRMNKAEPPPKLSIPTSSLDFESSLTSKTFTISNTGGGTLTWTISENIPWITSVSPTNGSNSGTITLTANRAGLSAGTYTGSILISSNGGNQVIPVFIDVPAAPPTLSMSVSTLDFGTSSTSKTFGISNTGGGTLTWTISESIPWITSVSPANGSNNGTITVTVNREGLSAGTYTGNISISSNGGNQVINIIMVKPEEPPTLSVSVSTLDFGTSSTSKIFSISNTGGGTLTWTISESIPWITSVSPANGSNNGTITVTANREGLSAGIYTGNITVSSNDGNQVIPVTMTIPVEPPTLYVSVSSLDFGSSSTSKAFIINNTGGGTLTWTISKNANWITAVSPTNGSNNRTITVTVNREGLSSGNYTGSISISSNGGNQVINILMEKPEEPPTLSVTVNNLDFGTSSTSKTFGISNTGGGTLTWTISESTPWITAISPSSGSNNRTVTVNVTREGLNPGTHYGTITISSNGGIQTITISITVPSPILTVSTSTLNLGTSSTSITFSISNTGGGTLSWNISENIGWVTSVSPINGTGNKTITVQVSRDGLRSETNYVGFISITSNGGTHTIDVIMEVPAPSLSLSVTKLDFGSSSTSMSFTIKNLGGGSLNWTIAKNATWITSVSPSNGTNDKTITVNVSRSGLSKGTHVSQLVVLSNDGNHTIPIYITVAESNVIVQSYKDAYVHERYPYNNYGSKDYAEVVSGEYFARAFVQFNNSIPQNATIVSAYLSLKIGLASEAPFDLYISRVTQFWSEGTITWSTQPSYTNTIIYEIAKPEGGILLDITDQYKKSLIAGANYGFAIAAKEQRRNFRHFVFYTREQSGTINDPKLIITYINP